MNDSTIVITGMILLMAPIAYDHPGKSKTIHAAVAVNATNPISAYGVDIPEHYAALVLPSRGGLQTNAGDRLVDDVDSDTTSLELHGDLVQIGTFKDNTCTAIPDDPTDADHHATITNSIKALPRMADLVEDEGKRKLYDDSHPNKDTGEFKDVNPDKVAAWLQIPLGRLLAVHSAEPQDDNVMFLPLHRNAMVAKEVRWHITEKADCVLVTPFKNGNPVYVYFKLGKVSMIYENNADMDSGEIMRGIGFDFEVLYGLFVEKPKMPPVPFSVGLISHGPTHANNANDVNASHGTATHANKGQETKITITNANTGVNCGPATIPSGG